MARPSRGLASSGNGAALAPNAIAAIPATAKMVLLRPVGTMIPLGGPRDWGLIQSTRKTVLNTARSTRLVTARPAPSKLLNHRFHTFWTGQPMPVDPSKTSPHQITGLLRDLAGGHREALDQLLPLVYEELHRMAHSRLRHESTGHTLETGALVHEAWLRLIIQHRAHWNDRAHFFAVASEAMRRILIDHARQRRSQKRGGATVPLPLELVELSLMKISTGDDSDTALVALDEALQRLERFNPDGARVVQYRFFAGLTNPEIAALLGTSERTVRRSWNVARAWLRRELTDFNPDRVP